MTTRTIYIVPARQATTVLPLNNGVSVNRSKSSAAVASSFRPTQLSLCTLPRQCMKTTTIIRPVYAKSPVPSVASSSTSTSPLSIHGKRAFFEEPSVDDLLGLKSSSGQPVRKREKLNHLTAEEKLDRRKLKNRVAAQTARDRRKARTARLEDAVRRLLAENESLRDENQRMKVMCEELRCRNRELENVVEEAKKQVKVSEATERSTSFGPAASISGPQQREREVKSQKSASLIMLLLLVLLSRKSSTISSKTTRNSSVSANKCSKEKMPRILESRDITSSTMGQQRRTCRKAGARREWIARLRISI
ncbi:hypothetical protein AB6A40_002448 [Gnathostoma spinigerum]|uniref:X-box-binding protein 1 n=1 Tax=Gnathostoma spinigerum TaxID=75299 RepID=A0ABD6EEF7_9BILA